MNKKNFYKFTAQVDTKKPARLDLFGEIGGAFWAGFDESTFAADMAELDDEQPLNIYINSGGGSVFAAMAIYNMIERHKGAVTITVAGLAASAATIITSAKNARVIMPVGSMMMVHPVRIHAPGMTADELKQAAENLEKVQSAVKDIYIGKTGKPAADIDNLMNKESYLTAREAVDLGFADELDETQKVENTICDGFYNINGLKVCASLFDAAPAGFITPHETAKVEREVKKMNIETIKAEHPEIVEAIRKEGFDAGVMDERARIKAIEDIATAGHSDLVESAKFTNAISAEQLAVAILKAEKAKAAAGLMAVKADSEEAFNELYSEPIEGNTGIDIKGDKTRAVSEFQSLIASELNNLKTKQEV